MSHNKTINTEIMTPLEKEIFRNIDVLIKSRVLKNISQLYSTFQIYEFIKRFKELTTNWPERIFSDLKKTWNHSDFPATIRYFIPNFQGPLESGNILIEIENKLHKCQILEHITQNKGEIAQKLHVYLEVVETKKEYYDKRKYLKSLLEKFKEWLASADYSLINIIKEIPDTNPLKFRYDIWIEVKQIIIDRSDILNQFEKVFSNKYEIKEIHLKKEIIINAYESLIKKGIISEIQTKIQEANITRSISKINPSIYQKVYFVISLFQQKKPKHETNENNKEKKQAQPILINIDNIFSKNIKHILNISRAEVETAYKFILENKLLVRDHPKLTIDSVLKNNIRDKINKLIILNPGVILRKIMKHFNISPKYTTWNLDVLKKFGYIRKKIHYIGKKTYNAYYPFNQNDNNDFKFFIVNHINYPNIYKTYYAIPESGSTTIIELTKITKFQYNLVKNYLHKLEKAEFIEFNKENEVYKIL
ncbi:MAG: hypothetical protein ACFFD2_12255 [Promethearchaeota archaeon]